jgi:DNA-binding NtrC family response regulator
MASPGQISGRVLVVDDEAPLRRTLTRLLRRLGLTVETAADGLEARALLASTRFDLCLTDLRMPNADGFAVLQAANACTPRLPVIVLTGHGTVTAAVEAMRGGALNFLTKPFNIEELEAVVCDALAPAPARAPGPAAGGSTGSAPARPEPAAPPSPPPPGTATLAGGAAAVFVGQHPRVRELLQLVERIADTDATVLITGESGTGKEVLARVLHATGCRAGRPFVAVNCAAIPETLLESELFGHARGAFTGATEAQRGRFAQAEGGTLFLDEIGELALPLQAKLLRVLQDKEYSPLGDQRTLHADIRILAATNADLEARVAAGRFRQDLLYRLSVIALEVPPLRERGEDIPLLAEHLLLQANRRLRRQVTGFADDVLVRFRRHAWPGNVRELENAIERAVAVRGTGLVELADLPPKLLAAGPAAHAAGGAAAAATPGATASGGDLKHALEDVEDRMILDALERTGGNKNRAAALLGMKRTTLVEKLKRKRRLSD